MNVDATQNDLVEHVGVKWLAHQQWLAGMDRKVNGRERARTFSGLQEWRARAIYDEYRLAAVRQALCAGAAGRARR